MPDIEQIIDGYFLPFSKEIESLARELRHYIRETTDPTTELVGPSTLSLNIGYGFTRKPWDCYCAIIIYSKHINISFPSGVGLHDPEGLLIGKGSRIRHLKVKSIEDLRADAAVNLLSQARDNALALSKASDRMIDKFQTFVKKSS